MDADHKHGSYLSRKSDFGLCGSEHSPHTLLMTTRSSSLTWSRAVVEIGRETASQFGLEDLEHRGDIPGRLWIKQNSEVSDLDQIMPPLNIIEEFDQ